MLFCVAEIHLKLFSKFRIKLLKQGEVEKMKGNDEAFEKKKTIDKMKLAQRIFAIAVIIIMLFSVCGTLLFYLLNR